MNGFQANLCLVCVTLCWSCEVIIYASIPDSVSSFATTCISSLIGAAILFAIFHRRIANAIRGGAARLFRRCAILGVLNLALNVCFIEGLRFVHVETGAFACIATAVITPVILALMHRRVPGRTWASVALIGLGIALVVFSTFSPGGLRGLPLIALGCVANALYIVKLGDFARESDPVAVSAIYLAIVGVLSFVVWNVVEPGGFLAFEWSTTVLACLFLHGYFVTAFATVVNSFANARTAPDSAAIIYSTEILFTVLWGVLLPPSIADPVALTPAVVAGCALVVAGNLVAIASPAAVARRLRPASVRAVGPSALARKIENGNADGEGGER